jgi:hypothetical protein
MIEKKLFVAKSLLKSACGYGMAENKFSQERFKKILQNIPDEDFDEFFYTIGRISEKSGADAFFDALNNAENEGTNG